MKCKTHDQHGRSLFTKMAASTWRLQLETKNDVVKSLALALVQREARKDISSGALAAFLEVVILRALDYFSLMTQVAGEY